MISFWFYYFKYKNKQWNSLVCELDYILIERIIHPLEWVKLINGFYLEDNILKQFVTVFFFEMHLTINVWKNGVDVHFKTSPTTALVYEPMTLS